jgi:hypothetical protein
MIKAAGEAPQHLVHQAADGTQGVIGRNPLLEGQVTEYLRLLGVVATETKEMRPKMLYLCTRAPFFKKLLMS